MGGGQKQQVVQSSAADTTTKDPDAVEQERLRSMGRAALLSGGQQGVLGNANVGRNSLLQR